MDPSLNPYRPSAGARPPALTGRDDLIASFAVTVERAKLGRPDKSLIPIGLRGVGKTALLNRLTSDAERNGAVVTTLEVAENGNFLIELAAATRSVLLRLDTLGKVTAAAGRALRVLSSFTYTLPDGASVNVGIEPLKGEGDSGLLRRDLADLLVAAGRAAADREKSLIIAIDEMQLVHQAHLEALIQAIHRTTQLDLPVVLVGTGLPQIPALLGDAKTYAERLFLFPEIGSLSREAAYTAVVEPAQDGGVLFEPDAAEAIFEKTKGYPFFIQEWAHDAWNNGSNNRIRHHDVEEIHATVQERLDRNFFRVRFDRLTELERQYLRAMAEFGAVARTGEVAAVLGRTSGQLGPTRDTLIKKGMIYAKEYGVAAFSVPLFDAFMKRAIPLDPPQPRKA